MARMDDDSIGFLEEAEAGPPLALMVLVALMVIAMIAGGTWYLIQGRGAEEEGTGALIAAPAGPYKVKDAGANGMDIEGQGDAAFAASQGQEPQGQIDLNAAPETPIAVKRVEPKAPAATPAAKACSRGCQARRSRARAERAGDRPARIVRHARKGRACLGRDVLAFRLP